MIFIYYMINKYISIHIDIDKYKYIHWYSRITNELLNIDRVQEDVMYTWKLENICTCSATEPSQIAGIGLIWEHSSITMSVWFFRAWWVKRSGLYLERLNTTMDISDSAPLRLAVVDSWSSNRRVAAQMILKTLCFFWQVKHINVEMKEAVLYKYMYV